MKKIIFILFGVFLLGTGSIYFYNLSVKRSSINVPNNPRGLVFNQPIIDSVVSSQKTTSNQPVLDENEVIKHNKTNDCYLIVNNNVYDVSSYINIHPGGSGQIVSRCGKEVTGIFAQIHSNRAWDILAKYKIGVLNLGSTNTANINLNNSTKDTLNLLKDGFKKANPDVEIINIKPKNNFFVLKAIYKNNLYEIHISSDGKIIKQEIESDEFDWSVWDSDRDDQIESTKI